MISNFRLQENCRKKSTSEISVSCSVEFLIPCIRNYFLMGLFADIVLSFNQAYQKFSEFLQIKITRKWNIQNSNLLVKKKCLGTRSGWKTS